MQNTLPKHELWTYTTKLYAEPGVKEICLYLQETYQINVNVLLFCCWYAASGRGHLSKLELKAIQHEINSWHNKLTLPLRQLRKTLKRFSKRDGFSEIIDDALSFELTSEHIEQLLIANVTYRDITKRLRKTDKRGHLSANIHHYFLTLNLDMDHAGYKLLEQLMEIVFPNSSKVPPGQLSML